MERSSRKKRSRHLIFFIVGVLLFQFIIIALIFSNVNIIDNTIYNNDAIEEEKEQKEIIVDSDGILPNLTRIGYPLILNMNKTDGPTGMWNELWGHHVDNIRVAYYSLQNEWVLVPFQIDELGYFRGYKYEMGFQADIGLFGSLNEIELANWGTYDVQHRYVGKHIDDDESAVYDEPTKFEAEQSAWPVWSQENPQPSAPVQDGDELISGPTGKMQIERRIDWDDEICFMSEGGKKASQYSWWNFNEYPKRFTITVNDPVDGGQTWMYVYYNDVDITNPPNTNFYIPTSGPYAAKDWVSYDKSTYKITAETYDMYIMDSNNDLHEDLQIKWPGLEVNDLLTSNLNQWLSAHAWIHGSLGGMIDIDLPLDTNVWREGEWDEGSFDEQLSVIGYNILMDFDFDHDLSGHRVAGDPVAEGKCTAGQTHYVDDTAKSTFIAGEVVPVDSADHDGNSAEITPFIRGTIDISNPTKEAAIDGPCRVILDKMAVQLIGGIFPDPANYEELYTISNEALKFYGSMYQTDPYTLDLDMNNQDLADMGISIDIHPYYGFMFMKRYSDFVRTDPEAFIWMGQAPNGVAGIKQNYVQCRPGGVSWPVTLLPDATSGNDGGVLSGGNPDSTHFTTSPALVPSRTTNPLPDWNYLSTSSGGAWSYNPFQEWLLLFPDVDPHPNNAEANADLCTYWKDTGSYTELGLYGNDAAWNGATSEFIRRTVLGNFTYWECLREYARTKEQLNDLLVWELDTPPPGGSPIFEDGNLYINGQPATEPFVKDGDVVWIDCDMNDHGLAYDTWTIDISAISDGSASVGEIDAGTRTYRVSFTVDSQARPDKVPDSAGYAIFIEFESPVPPYYTGNTTEELYLDNTDPTAPAPGQWSVTQPDPNTASLRLAWTGEEDNGNPDLVDHVEMWRNGSYKISLDKDTNSWDDNSVSAGKYYEYFIRVYDKVGHYTDTSDTKQFYVNLLFNPCTPDPLPQYTNGAVTLDWNNDPGDIPPIVNYRVWWSKTPNPGDYLAINPWLGAAARSFIFDPAAYPSPRSGPYYLKVENDGGVSIYSSPQIFTYDIGDPLPATITDIPDEYHPPVAEIPIQWSGAFDGISGIDYYYLYRNKNSAGWVQIPSGGYEFDEAHKSYVDTDIANNDYLQYMVGVFDVAGNGPIYSTIEEVTYYDDQVNPTPNLWINNISCSVLAEQKGVPFTVYVRIENTGGAAGTVTDINLKLIRGGQDVTGYYTGTSWSGSQVVNDGTYWDRDFTVTATGSALEGEITVDAQMIGTNNDNDAESPATIWIRTQSALSITNMYADDPVGVPSTSNLISMNVTNPMVTTVTLTAVSLTLNGWGGGDYVLTEGSGFPTLPKELVGGESVVINWDLEVITGAPEIAVTVDFHAVGTEDVTGWAADKDEIGGASFDAGSGSPNLGPPSVGNYQMNPDPADPDAGEEIVITCDVQDPDGIASVTGYIVDDFDVLIDTFPMGFIAGNQYRYDWNCSGNPEGTYYLNVSATDAHVGDPQTTEVYHGDSVQLTDATDPNVAWVSVSDDPLELGDTQTITAFVTDGSGIQWVRLYLESDDENSITDFYMYDDGVQGGDLFSGDDIYTGEWDSTGATLSPPSYYIDIDARDSATAPNTANLDNQETFDLQDSQGPTLGAGNIVPDSGEADDTFTISIFADDPSGILDVWAYVQFPDEVLNESLELFDDGPGGGHGDAVLGDDIYTNQWTATAREEGIYYVDIIAQDNVPNSREAENIDNNITIGDATPPTVQDVNVIPAIGDPEAGTNLTITANVTDVSGILWVMADIDLGGVENIVDTIQLYDDGSHGDVTPGDDIYTNEWNCSGFAVGAYWVDIRARDDSLAQNLADMENLDSFDLIDNTVPTVTNILVSDNPLEKGNIQTITCLVVDFSGISSVRAYLEMPDEFSITDFLLFDDGAHGDGGVGDGVFGNTWDSSSAATGHYFVDIQARDGSPATNEENIDNGANFWLEDNTGPTILIPDITPNSGEPGQVFIITADVSDLSGITSVTAYIQYPIDETDNTTIILYDDGAHNDGGNGDGVYGNSWDSTGYEEGNYWLDIIAIDNSNNSNPTESENVESPFVLGDVTPPTIVGMNINPASGDPEAGTIFTIWCTATDASGIAEVWATIENGSLVAAVELFDDGNLGLHGDAVAGDDIYSNLWDCSPYYPGAFNVDFNATDNSINSNTQPEDNGDSFTLVDGTAPVIANVQVSEDPIEFANILTINCTITDLSGIFDAIARIQYPSGTTIDTITLYDDGSSGGDLIAGDNIFTGQWDTALATAYDQHWIDIRARDDSPAQNVQLADDVISFTIQDTIAPDVTGVNVNPASGDPTPPGQDFTITVDVTDESNVLSVVAYIQNSTLDYIATVTLYDDGVQGGDVVDGDDTWTGQWSSSGFPEDTYTIDVNATDNSPDQNVRSIDDGDTFDLDDLTLPTIQNTNVAPNAGPINQLFTITAQITDFSGIAEAWARIENGTFQAAVQLVDDGSGVDAVAGDDIYSGEWDSAGFSNDTYNVDFNATDASGNSNVQTVDNAETIILYIGDLSPPAITNPQVDKNIAQVGESVTITATISDVSGIYTPNVTISNNTDSFTFNMTNTGGDDWEYVWNTGGYGVSTYNISINATDKSVNENLNYLANFDSVNLTQSPIVTDIQVSDDPLELGDLQIITCNVSDLSGIQSVTAFVQNSTETTVATITLFDDGAHNDGANGDGIYGNTWDSSSASLGNYFVDITAIDSSPSNFQTDVDNGATFTLDDTLGPIISNEDIYPHTGEPGQIFQINVTVTDESGIASVTAYVQQPNENDVATITLFDDGAHGDGANGDGIYGNTWDSTGFSENTYFVDVVAIDASIYSHSSESEDIDANIIISDLTPPSVLNVDASPAIGDPEAGTIITITADVDDPSGITSVTAYINDSSDATIATFALFDDGLHNDGFLGDGLYGNTWDSTGTAVGTYTVDIKAIDNSLAQNEQYIGDGDSFDLVDNTDPTVVSVLVSDDPLELGDVQTITCDVSDFSGILSVIAYIQNSTSDYVTTLTLFDDGPGGGHGDVAIGDDIYTNQWDSTGFPEDTYTIDVNATDNSAAQNVQTVDDGDSFVLEDTTMPTVVNVDATPATGDPEAGTIITITCDVSDESDILAVLAYIQNSTADTLVILTLYDDGAHGDGAAGDGTYGNTWDCTGFLEDTYDVDINATDDSNVQNERYINNGDSFTLTDSTPPIINDIQVSDSPLELGDIQTITCNISDMFGISSATAFVQDSTETTVATITLFDDGTHGDGAAGDGTYGNTWDSSTSSVGLYYLDIRARDASGALNEQYEDNSLTFNVQDTQGPSVSNIIINDVNGGDPEPGDIFDVIVDVDDLSGIQNVTLEIEFPDEVLNGTVIMYDDGLHGDGAPLDGTFGGSWDSTGKSEGRFWVDVVAYDNNDIFTDVDNMDNITLGDATAPNIFNGQASPDPADPELGENVVITCNVTDIAGVDTVIAYIQHPDGTTLYTLIMFNDGLHGDDNAGDYKWGVIWNCSHEALGNYFVDIFANDSSINANFIVENNEITFNLVDATLPVILDFNIDQAVLETGDFLTINVSVNDYYGIDSVSVNIELSINRSVNMFDDGISGGDLVFGDNIWTGRWDSSIGAGDEGSNIPIHITVTDSSFNSFELTDAITFDFQDTTAPSIAGIQVNPTEIDIGIQNVTISALVIDINAIGITVMARIYNISEDVAALILYDDGTHGDLLAGDNRYTNQWNSSGFMAGFYNISINATDIYNNLNTVDWIGSVELKNPEPIVGYSEVFVDINGYEKGYIGEDIITILIGINVSKTDIWITNVSIIDLDSGIYSSYFSRIGINISYPEHFGISSAYTYIEINYSILATAIPQEGIDLGNFYIEYEDQFGYQWGPIDKNTYKSISIYDPPEITDVIIDINEVANFTSYPNTFTFKIYGSYLLDLYQLSLNLTTWNETGLVWSDVLYLNNVTVYTIDDDLALVTDPDRNDWDSINLYYYITICNFTSGVYDGSQISVIMNTAIDGCLNQSIVVTLDKWVIKVDNVDPIIDDLTIAITYDSLGTIDVIALESNIDPGFYIFVDVIDDPIAETGILSVSIDVGGKTFYLSNDTIFGPIVWSVYIDLDDIDPSKLQVNLGTLSIGFIIATDNAQNTDQYDASGYSIPLIDLTAPTIDWDSFTIGGFDISDLDDPIELPAGTYLSIEVEVSEDDFGLGIMYVKVWYKIEGGGIETAADEDYESITLAKIGDKYFGVLSAPNEVGFSADMKVELYFEISDFEENKPLSGIGYSAKKPIELVFTEETPVMSLVILSIAFISFLGAIIFRIGFFRKKAKIIDIDSKLIKQKK